MIVFCSALNPIVTNPAVVNHCQKQLANRFSEPIELPPVGATATPKTTPALSPTQWQSANVFDWQAPVQPALHFASQSNVTSANGATRSHTIGPSCTDPLPHVGSTAPAVPATVARQIPPSVAQTVAPTAYAVAGRHRP